MKLELRGIKSWLELEPYAIDDLEQWLEENPDNGETVRRYLEWRNSLLTSSHQVLSFIDREISRIEAEHPEWVEH
ncbi:MAG: hypothetical protein HN846_00340 [Candidatus Pacebacteria bacterium]|jgi:hypothetical protein|nr:hypothetical protein [Candidatus Paceibacterota bacterium]MBT3512071.1 hypothetical protein [Candidatus Paceibacterota bacterium]MBT4004814.1 hypothetical protein [Candidatus Paceibacterota bacterium]MBT4358479.1 hypothetical protein [Candidatus Paceibacterota bacterium]MBT4681263.1 hypothetical protein [Candidatus Paceibacterota bacterium]